jgi:hypothetical protein
MENVFGRRFAFWAQARLPQFKYSMVRLWDKTVFRLEKLTSPES